MRRWIMAVTVLALLLMAGALPGLAQQDQARLRAVHASPGGPPVNVVVNGNTAFPDVAYKDITDYAAVNAGPAEVQLVPAGGQQALIDTTVDLQANTDYTMVAVGEPDSIEPLVLVDDNTPPGPGQARVRFVHASPDAPAVNVAVQGGQVLFSNVSFKGVGNYVSVPAGNVTLEVRDAGSDAVLLTVPNVALAECTVYTIFAVGLAGGDPPLETITSTDATTTCAAPAAGATATPGSAATAPATVRTGAPAGRTGTPAGTRTGTPAGTRTGTVTRTGTAATATTATTATRPATVTTPGTVTGQTPPVGVITRNPGILTAVARTPFRVVTPPPPAEPPGGPPLVPTSPIG